MAILSLIIRKVYEEDTIIISLVVSWLKRRFNPSVAFYIL